MTTKLQHFLANLLILLLVLEPFSFALAGGITVAPGAPASKQPTIDAAANGVPVVNIVKPNAAGFSHNQFDQFNVAAPGVIINNSSSAGVSQLGGAIAGNANFGGGTEARIILNEVTGSSRSRIEGYTEVFGFAAQYILANPNGISVNGGGFINTPKATLTTGAPRLDAAGGLLGLDVRRGDVLIEGLGVNAGNLDAFEIVSRTAKINAEIHARKLSIIAGQGSFDPATGQSAPLAPDGSAAPSFAIDSTVLGGMYAQRITFVGTEKGVGVNLEGATHATEQLTLSADGALHVKGAVSSDKNLSASSLDDSVVIAGSLAAKGTAEVRAAKELRLQAQAGGSAPLLYGQNVNITAKTLNNVDGQMFADAALAATVASDAANSGTIYSGSGLTLATTGSLRNAGQVLAKNSLDVTTAGRIENSGKVQSGGTASVRSAGDIDNAGGEILAQGGMVLEATGNLANTGSINTTGLASISAGGILSNTGGSISSHGDLELGATGSLSNTGTIYSGASGTVRTPSLLNSSTGQILALGNLLFENAANLENQGLLRAGQTATMTTGGFSNQGGQILAQSGIALNASADVENTGTLNSGGFGTYRTTGLLRNTGSFLTQGDATFSSAGDFVNTGILQFGGRLEYVLGGNLLNTGGQILVTGDSLLAANGDLTNTGLLFTGGTATYRVGGTLLNSRGQMLSQGDMLLEGAAPGTRMLKLQNDSGLIESLQGSIGIKADNVLNNNLDFSLEEGAIPGTTLEGGLHSYGNDGWGVGPIFTWATGHGPTSGLFTWNSCRIYLDYVNALGLDAARNVFSLAELTAAVNAAELELQSAPNATRQTKVNWVKSTILATQVPYAVVILPGQRGEITVYEATTSTDRAAGMDKGASIAASTSIAIDTADFRNNVSKVSTATGDISINAASFENVGRTLYERSTVKWGRGFTNNSSGTGVYSEGNGQEVLLSPVGYAYGTVSAGGTVAITAAHVQNGIAENSGVASSTSGSATTPGAPQGAIIAPPSPAANGQTFSSMSSVIGALPQGGLFSVNATPGHHYLVETNPALTSMASFYGSDYFLSRAGIDLDKTHQQLLGDAFYETTLVREQVFALTGKRLLSSSATGDAEQMQALMDSALRAKSSLDLTIGVALSEAQLARLTEDIVWLEKTVVDGHEVLAPKVYLASASLEKIAQGGSVIVGKDVAITTTGDTSNTGVIQATNTLTINAANIFNTLGTMQGQTAALAATGSITNTSGLIKGGEVTLAAGKNIVSDTASVTFASSNTTSEVANQRGRIEASGGLNMQAGENISLIGSDTAAGGSATLSAGKDVVLAAQQTTSSFATSQGSKYSASASVVGNQEATLSTGGALSVTAGQDAVIHGSTVQAGGDASLSAGRNLSITSATDTYEFSRHLQSKSGGLFGGKSSESASGSGGTNVASQVTSGGTLSAEAGTAGSGDLVVSGSKVASGGAMSLKAADDVLVASAQEESSSAYSSSNSGLLSSKSKAQTSYSLTQIGSELTSGSTLAIEGNKGVTVSASTVQAEGDVTLKSSAGDVRVLAAQNESASSSKEKKSGIGLFVGNGRIDVAQFKEASSKASESGNVSSTVASGHDVAVLASNDASVVGSTVAATNDVNLTAGRDVNIVPGRNAKQSQSSSTETGIGIGYSLSENEAGISIGLKSTEKGENSSGQYNAKSLVSAGNDVNIQAGRNVNQISSDIEAGRDVKTSAGQDVNVTAAKDVEHLDQYVKETEAGVSLAVRQSVTTAVRTVAELPQAATAGKGGVAAEAVTAGSAGVKAVSSVMQAMNSSASASLTAGISVSENRSSNDSATSVVSSVTAGNNVEQAAGRDVTLAGAQVQGGKDVTLAAGRDVAVTAAQNQYSSSQSSSSASVSAGIGASAGANGVSAGYQLSAALSGSDGASQSQSNTNAQVGAGETLTVKSGQDTTIAGANLGGKDVKMDVGRDLTVASLQDTASSSSSSYNIGATVTVGPVPGVVKDNVPQDTKVGQTGNSGSFGLGSGSSSSAWVNGQTSIIGSNSVDIRTEKNTHVEGAVIAAENGSLKLDTGTLTYKDLQDKDTGSNTQVGVSVPLGGALGTSASTEKPASQPDDAAKPSPVTDFLMGSTLSGSYDSHDKRQVNRATIGEGTIIIRSDPAQGLAGLNRDLQKAQELTKDSKTSVTVYVDPAAVKELKGIADKVVEAVQKARADAKTQERLQNAKLPDDLKHLEDKNGLAVMKAMISAGATDEAIAQQLRKPEFQELLISAATLQAQLESSGLHVDGNSPSGSTSEDSGLDGNTYHIDITYPDRAGERLLGLLDKAKKLYDSIPNKEEAALVLLGAQVALSGPLGVVWEIGKSVLIESVAGKEIEQAKQALSVQFASLLRGWDIQADLDKDKGSYGPIWEESIEASRFGLDIFIGATGILAGSGIKGEAGKLASTILPKSIIELSEANITKSGKTVIGHFKIDEGMDGVNYVEKAKQLKASYFSLGETWGILEPAERLAANAHFLDVIAAKGDVVILSVPKSQIKPNTSLTWEIEYLINTHGYAWAGEILKKAK